MSKIKAIKAREVLDSRGNPTVECDVITNKGVFRAMVPSGASAGVHEAVELRDEDQKRYMGLGGSKAVNNIDNIITENIIGIDCTEQSDIDEDLIELDGTEN